MKKYITILFISIFALTTACKKDEPTPETDQEEVGSASITFTEVAGEAHGDHYHYTEIENPEVEKIDFTGSQMLPPVGAHTHLEVGKSYRFNVTIKDFAGRETQQSFVEKDDNHFAFILNIPEDHVFVTYSDKKNDGTKVKVGVQGYITVLKASSTFTTRYIMRHLNPKVKETIDPKKDWNNTNFTSFTGANDLDLKFDLHFTEDGHGH
ncbi:MAG: hypothetical protein LBE37_18230 [Sphingobacterium sp.]|jgi:hypothetical protein|nr:hypothetical protein [Sphingobacterium sp.]